MKRGLFRGGLTAIVLSLSAITFQSIYVQETKQTITVNTKKYFIIPDKTIRDEKQNRVTDQRILGEVIETYILSQELPKYKKIAENNLKDFNRTKLLTQLKELTKAYTTVLKKPLENILSNLNSSSPLSTKLNLGKGLLDGTIEALTNTYFHPKMILYAEITSELKRAERDYKQFIRLIDKVDLKNHRNAKNLYNLLLRSEPIIKAATYSFKEIRDSKNSQLRIQEKKEISLLLSKKDTPTTKGKRRALFNRIRSRAKRTKEARNYKQAKEDAQKDLKKILKNISIKFYSNREQH